ncbi:alpha/beta hydrolase [Brooklawnia cerclae]|uniref:Alpha-beta hydrolase superfamily lysophospholipase n=1 Tax=Brooklawnia cerclae TaxID=349934 RepID=A0ABX0SCJ1_9ACTN|nr:alpha/beta hydrolase [Brooklawnia cerclae]NIH55711.1 alpha-beta hydrolase superfamily lysophospholipase [Brooklawnia cerclae]
MNHAWVDDRLLRGYQATTWPLEGAQIADGEPDSTLTATLVRRNAPRHARAVLYVHGWNDYFFQTHLADFWDREGFDFYAIDLHRYGRNLRPGLFAGYTTDLDEYVAELDEAYDIVRAEGHDLITVNAHSTGGLVASLWVAGSEHQFNGVVLNSPWLDMSAPELLRRAAMPLITSVAALKPTSVMQTSDTGFYARTIFADQDGEWTPDHDYKSNPAFLARFGWGKAILRGQERVAESLGIQTPVLSMMSARSNLSATKWDESLNTVDLVLDVDRLAAISWRLGALVTIVRIENGMHDLVLSPHPVRDEVFAEISRWLKVYVR